MSDYPPPPPPPRDDQPPFPPPPPPPPPPGAYGVPGPVGPASSGYFGPVDDHGRPLAEWWQRVVAWIMDTFVLLIPSLILASSTDSKFVGALLSVVLGCAYFGLLNGGPKGQTLGKIALKIQVREATSGGPLGPEKAVVRYLVDGIAAFVPALLVFNLLDGLWPLWDPKRQAIHDKVVNSLVIKVPG
jgi:uncharacterized RDD family membrane protein YckC